MPDGIRVLIVDDEAAARYGLRRALDRSKYEIGEARDGVQALERLQDGWDVVFLDLNMPGMDGLDVLRRAPARARAPLVVIVTAHGSERLAVEAMKAGAFDYLTKPYDVEELRAIARNAAERVALSRENDRLKRQLKAYTEYGELIGQSDPMRRLYDMIERVARTDLTVLIHGESGTGKELVAQEIHRRSARAEGPFLAMNSAAVPESLVESELFGYERGAFSGADQRRRGKLEAAHRGTLFLDEVGDMSPGTQAKLLRVLQERAFERLGSVDRLVVDVRFIAATNKDLAREAAEGRFRLDLLYRLQVVEIALPPLRARSNDIPLLASHFLQLARSRYPAAPRDISPAAMRALTSAPWPGNVRELQNTVERAVAMTDHQTIEVADLAFGPGPRETATVPETVSGPDDLPYREARRLVLERFDRAYLERELARHDGNISRTAAALGVHRQSLQQKLRELGIRKRS